MAGQALVDNKISIGAKATFILLAGALSMFFAEVCSGASVLWFLTPWAWLVTFWLYLAHTIFFVNLAFYFKRFSVTSLYLWGVFFGLYEAWITKVTWAGYVGQTPSMGTFLGFAVNEFPIIVFFWHPVMSFILPVLAFEVLSGRILPVHINILNRSRRNRILALAVVLVGATCLALNSKSNAVATVITALGSFVLISSLYWIAKKRYESKFSIEALRLGKTGMAILSLYLALLYLGTFFFLLPERIAPPLTILLTLGVYGVIALMLYLKKPDREMAPRQAEKNAFGVRDPAILGTVFTIMAAILCLLPAINYPLTVVVYLALTLLAPILFAMALGKTLMAKKADA